MGLRYSDGFHLNYYLFSYNNYNNIKNWDVFTLFTLVIFVEVVV